MTADMTSDFGTSDFVGRIDVSVPLSDRERRLYVFDAPCPWVPCRDGCCLELRGTGDLEASLADIVGMLHRPGREFAGMVVGCRRADGEVVAVSVRRNRVSSRVLRAGQGLPRPRLASVIELEDRRRGRALP
jgi:hypothetical protein